MAGLFNAEHGRLQRQQARGRVSETLYQDLALVTDQIGASVLCPFFVPTGITSRRRNRPAAPSRPDMPTWSQLVAQAMNDVASASGKWSAAVVARFPSSTPSAQGRFYIWQPPQAPSSVQTRLEDIMQIRNPTDPFAGKPEIGVELKAALRASR